MIEPTQFQILIIGLALVGGIVSILFGGTWYYARDCKLHPQKHENDFKVRDSWKRRFGE